MLQFSQRQRGALDELVEWWEDICHRKIGSQAIFLAVPRGWGRRTVLDGLAAGIDDPDAYPTIAVRIPAGSLPEGAALQAEMLRDCFAGAVVRHRAAELLGVDRLGGVIQFALGVVGLMTSAFGALLGMLAANVAVGAASRVWDDSPAGEEGAVARLARAVAHVSVSIPVVVMIDDADQIDTDLALALMGRLIERHDGQVLVIAAVDPGSTLMSSLRSRSQYGLAEGRVHVADADAGMGQGARAALATEMRPDLPRNASRRIGQRTRTFADVFRVVAADRLEDLASDSDDATIRGIVDAVTDARIRRPDPSPEAIALAWADGPLHRVQADRVLDVMGAERSEADHDVVRLEFLVRLARPPSSQLAEEVQILATAMRHQMAAAVLETAIDLIATPSTSVIERVVACQAVQRVRSDLGDRRGLASVQCELVEGLEALGDLKTAGDVAEAALAESGDVGLPKAEHAKLAAAVLRLAGKTSGSNDDPVVESAVEFALEGGAAVSLEARIWAAVDLLGQPGRRDVALTLADQVAAQLESQPIPEALSDQWRLLLAFHAGKAGYTDGLQQLLAPLLAADSAERQDAARAVLHAVDDPNGDTRLQIAILGADLAALPADAEEDRLRLHSALASAYGRIGDYRHALAHGQRELELRNHAQGPDHPQTFSIRSNVAFWTGVGGDPRQGLRLFRELLTDQTRALGPHHPSTLKTRANIASLTGQSGHPAEALRLFQELLPDREQALGRAHPDTLNTRANIAFWTGECGNRAEALRLLRKLLPDRQRVLGPKHPDTLANRGNIAFATGLCGDPPRALRLFQELLHDREQVLGQAHPDTLGTRANIANLTGQCGNPAEALRLFQELLPDEERVLGPDHPTTLSTRNNIAGWTGECGDRVEALRLFQQVLPDMERALGPRHPNTLKIRHNIAGLTAQCGYPAEALRLFRQVLPDLERVLGPNHPDTLNTRNNIAALTRERRQ
jgi:tetratricopeptide (TPR) repeat protein